MTVSAFAGLSDSAFSDSSWNFFKSGKDETRENPPHMSRMTSRRQQSMGGAWCPATNSDEEYLEVDLRRNHVIRDVETRGCDGEDWFVRSFRLQLAKDGDVSDGRIEYRKVMQPNSQPHVFKANSDNFERVKQSEKLQCKICYTARYVRIVPLEFEARKALRWEIYAESKLQVHAAPVTCVLASFV